LTKVLTASCRILRLFRPGFKWLGDSVSISQLIPCSSHSNAHFPSKPQQPVQASMDSTTSVPNAQSRSGRVIKPPARFQDHCAIP
ncbi:Hypothetical protein FKW44_006035, partial [Caligus rogercresseyi]